MENQPLSPVGLSGCSTGCSNLADGIHLTSDLAKLVERWPSLPAHIKAAVMALVATAPTNPPADSNGSGDALPPGFEKKPLPHGD